MSNTVQDTGGGLYVESSDGFALITNVIAANHAFNQGDGVYVRGWGNSYPSAGAMLHTTIADNGGDGLFADQFATVVMTNTLLVGHSVGLYAKSSSAHVEAAYTLWDAAKAYTYTVGGGAITATHTVTGSPAFVRRGDYHIQGVSDALDAAVVTGVDTDFEGDARPSACSLDDPDIGADENTDLTVVRPVRETNTFGAACARIVFKDTGAPALETITATTHLGSLLSPKPVGMIPLLRNTTLTPSGTTPVSISLALGYTDADLAAAGLSGAEEPALRLYRDLGENRWEPYSGTVNTIHNVVTATEVTTLSRWLIGVPASPPTADFSVSPTTGVAPLTVDFTNASMGVYDACKWTFGDGNSSTECDDPSHIYAASGAYTVSLAVHGPGGYNILTRTQALTVYQAVAANFNGNPTTGVAPLAVDFTNTSTGDYDTCDWNFGDGTSSGDCSDLSHTYIASGVYTVSLAVSGLGGSDTLTETDYITVDPVASAPTAGFTANPTQGIAPLLVDFTNTSTGDYDTCVWDFGDGQSSTNCNDPSHTYTASGAYTVSLNLSGTQGGDVLTRPNYITVDPVPPAPTAAFSGHPTSGTAPLAVEFTQASSGDYDTCVWAFGDGASSTDCTGTSHTYTSAGRYTVQLTVSGPGGSDTATRSDYITVDPPVGAPKAALSADPENGLVPLTVTFTAVTSGTVDQWLWTFGDGGTASTGPVVSHTYVTTGTFDVTLTVSNTHGRFLVSKPDYIWVRSQDYVYLPLVIR
jgi:PKD repeat protein